MLEEKVFKKWSDTEFLEGLEDKKPEGKPQVFC